jgi:hypothetical protein
MRTQHHLFYVENRVMYCENPTHTKYCTKDFALIPRLGKYKQHSIIKLNITKPVYAII